MENSSSNHRHHRQHHHRHHHHSTPSKEESIEGDKYDDDIEYEATVHVHKPSRRISIKLDKGREFVETIASVVNKNGEVRKRRSLVYHNPDKPDMAYKLVYDKKGRQKLVPLMVPVQKLVPVVDPGYYVKNDKNGLMYVKSRKQPGWIHVVSPRGRVLSHRVWHPKYKRWVYVSAKEEGYPYLEEVLPPEDPPTLVEDGAYYMPSSSMPVPMPAPASPMLIKADSGRLLPIRAYKPQPKVIRYFSPRTKEDLLYIDHRGRLVNAMESAYNFEDGAVYFTDTIISPKLHRIPRSAEYVSLEE